MPYEVTRTDNYEVDPVGYTVFCCDECGKEYDTEEDAMDCEDRHYEEE